MNCMKCGKETAGSNVFCESCLETMRAYPVKPGTAVQFPRRDPVEGEKRAAARQRTQQSKDPLRHLRGTIRWLTAVIAVLSALLCLTAAMLLHTLDNGKAIQAIQEWGRNYTAIIGD